MAAIPTIHRNGTSRESLYEATCDAMNAIRHAITAVEETSPNARDYYPQGDDAIRRALTEHTNRLDRLRSVLDELQVIAEAIADAP